MSSTVSEWQQRCLSRSYRAEPREDAMGAQAEIQRQCSHSTLTMHLDHKYRVICQVMSTQNSDKLYSGEKKVELDKHPTKMVMYRAKRLCRSGIGHGL